MVRTRQSFDASSSGWKGAGGLVALNPPKPTFILDCDTTDAFLDLPEPVYGPDRKTLEQVNAEREKPLPPIKLPPRERD